MSKIESNIVLKEDIQSVVHTSWIPWERFRDKKIAVTGATGLIGRSLIYTLLEAEKTYDLHCQILAFVRNPEKAKAMFSDIEIKEDVLQIVQQDVQNEVPKEIHADFLIHGASITTSKLMIQNPVETILTTVEGTHHMLDFASACQMEGVVYLSSMEAYGMVDPKLEEVRENDLGFVNLTNIRNGYSEGKRMAECLCTAYAAEYGVNVKIARLAQTFGAGISKEENRVFAQFARSIQKGEDIVLHTKGEKANCYCYTSDAVAAILLLLLEGEKGQPYNVANMDTFCSIRELAEQFLRFDRSGTCKLWIELPENGTNLGYAPDSILKLNSEKLMALGWKPEKNLPDMAERLLRSLESNHERGKDS